MRSYIYKKRRWLWLVRLLDGLGERLVGPFLRLPGKSLQPLKVRRVLVIKLDHLGDLVLATPALHLLRKGFPRARISLLAGPWARELMEGCPYLDELICYYPGWLERTGRRKIYWGMTLRLIRFLRKQRYEVCFELRGDLMSIVIGWAAGIPYRVGFGTAGCGWLLTHELTPAGNKHQSQILVDAVACLLPGKRSPGRPRIFLRLQEQRWAQEWIRQAGVRADFPLIAVHPGAAAPSRRWGVRKYADLIGRLVQELRISVLLLGGEAEQAQLDFIADRVPEERVYPLQGINVRRMAALLRCCRLFVGNNSGPAHLAAAVQTPVVVVFSAANASRRWAPYGEKVTVISKEDEIPCAGCERFSCERPRCMESISVDEVFAAVQRRWGESGDEGLH